MSRRVGESICVEEIMNKINNDSYNGYEAKWERNEEALDCRRCHRWFNLFIRRHHCRKCGQVICDRCSTNRALLPFDQIIQPPNIPIESTQPQRVCDACVDNLVYENSHKVNKRTTSIMLECPICTMNLISFETAQEREHHVQHCLNQGALNINSNIEFIVYTLDDSSTLIGQECIICFEEFKKDDIITRLKCICSYHEQCINHWFSKGKDCPVHSH